MFNRFTKAALSSLGLQVCWRHNQPRGVDWMLDLTRLVPNDAARTFLDIGANVGQTSRAIIARFPDARIHACEPVSSTFERLRAATAAHAGITCHRVGMSDRVGTAEFDAVPASVYNSLSLSSSPKRGTPSETVPVTTVDELMKEQGLERIDALKTDTEGHDLNVLHGAIGGLTSGAIRAVFTEVTFSRGNTRNTLFLPIQEFLEPLRFRFAGLYDMKYFQTKPWSESFCNALFVRDDSMSGGAGGERDEPMPAWKKEEEKGIEV